MTETVCVNGQIILYLVETFCQGRTSIADGPAINIPQCTIHIYHRYDVQICCRVIQRVSLQKRA